MDSNMRNLSISNNMSTTSNTPSAFGGQPPLGGFGGQPPASGFGGQPPLGGFGGKPSTGGGINWGGGGGNSQVINPPVQNWSSPSGPSMSYGGQPSAMSQASKPKIDMTSLDSLMTTGSSAKKQPMNQVRPPVNQSMGGMQMQGSMASNTPGFGVASPANRPTFPQQTPGFGMSGLPQQNLAMSQGWAGSPAGMPGQMGMGGPRTAGVPPGNTGLLQPMQSQSSNGGSNDLKDIFG